MSEGKLLIKDLNQEIEVLKKALELAIEELTHTSNECPECCGKNFEGCFLVPYETSAGTENECGRTADECWKDYLINTAMTELEIDKVEGGYHE